MGKKEYKKRLLTELKGGSPKKVVRLFGTDLGGVIIKIYDLISHNYVNEYIRMMRRYEYYHEKNHFIGRLIYIYCNWRWRKISALTGITIPRGVCAEGLTLYHYGSIVVNGNARIGRNVCISNNVNIGANKGESEAPKIGDNVFIGPGAVLFGNIEIADNCFIGANAVVTKSVLEPYSVVVGSPGKVIKKETKNWWQYNGLKRE